MKKVLVLGASGSIGTKALKLISSFKEDLTLAGVVTNTTDLNTEAPLLKAKDKSLDEISDFVDKTNPDIVLNGVGGKSGFLYSYLVLKKKIPLALANKETLTMGGKIIMDMGRDLIIPVDSEHSSLHTLLNEGKSTELYLTASGGPFLDRENETGITIEEALNHPVWKMGRKISIDSATMANKGLEVIEAHYLFDYPAEKIKVLIHREGFIHALVKKEDGSLRAFMSAADMIYPIAKALGVNLESRALPFPIFLSLYPWDENRFPLLKTAYECIEKGGSYPISYTASDEEAVNAFLSGKIEFYKIKEIVDEVLNHDFSYEAKDVDEVLDIALRAEKIAKEMIERN